MRKSQLSAIAFIDAHICPYAAEMDLLWEEMNEKDTVIHPEHPMDPPPTVPSHGGLVMASIKKEMTA